jgi:hypothetical protein
MMVIVGSRTEIIIEILIVDSTSASPGAGMERRRRRRCAVSSGQKLIRRHASSTNKFQQ